jgi:hypothetical protein
MSRISEQRDVQNNLIHYLMGNDWTYLPPGDVAQWRSGDETQPFLPGVLRGQLLKLKPGLVTAANVDDVIRRLRLLPANLAGHEDYVKGLRGQWTVYDTAEKRERNLALADDALQLSLIEYISSTNCYIVGIPIMPATSKWP